MNKRKTAFQHSPCLCVIFFLALFFCFFCTATSVLADDFVQFSARFVDADKQPMAGYPVNVIEKSGAIYTTLMTDASGVIAGSLPVKSKFTLRLLNYDGQCIIFDKTFKTGKKAKALGDIVVKSPQAKTAVVKGTVTQNGKPADRASVTYIIGEKHYTVAVINGKYEFKVYFCDAKPQISITAANSTGDAISETRTVELGKGNNKIKMLELVARAEEDAQRVEALTDKDGNNTAKPDVYPVGPEKASGWVRVNYEGGPSVLLNDIQAFSGGRSTNGTLFFSVTAQTVDTYQDFALHWYVEHAPLTVGTYTCRFKYISPFYDEDVDGDVGLGWIAENTSTYISGANPLLTEGVLTITSCERVMASNPNSLDTAQAFYILDGHFEIKNIYYSYRYRHEKIIYGILSGMPYPELDGYRNLSGNFHLEGWCAGEYVSPYSSDRNLNK